MAKKKAVSKETLIQPTMTITKSYHAGKVVTKEMSDVEKIEIQPLPDIPLASVSFSAGVTINQGNFNSCKISVGVTLPSTLEELPAAYETAREFALSRLKADEDNIKKV